MFSSASSFSPRPHCVGTAAEGANGVEVVGAVDIDAVVVVAFGIGDGLVHAVFCGGTGFLGGGFLHDGSFEHHAGAISAGHGAIPYF